MTRFFCDKCGAEAPNRGGFYRVFCRVLKNDSTSEGVTFELEVCAACEPIVRDEINHVMSAPSAVKNSP